jgi:hypothetical protein
MKHYIVCIILLVLVTGILAQPTTLPRTYVQRIILENQENPQITSTPKVSAPEYVLKAWIVERPKDVMTTGKQPYHSISVKEVGDDVKFARIAIVSVQLGNFKSQWRAGETLRLELRHKKSKQKVTWDVPIPEGTTLIKHLDDPITVPPFAKKKK